MGFERVLKSINGGGISKLERESIPQCWSYGAESTFPVVLGVCPGCLEEVQVVRTKISGGDIFSDKVRYM